MGLRQSHDVTSNDRDRDTSEGLVFTGTDCEGLIYTSRVYLMALLQQ